MHSREQIFHGCGSDLASTTFFVHERNMAKNFGGSAFSAYFFAFGSRGRGGKSRPMRLWKSLIGGGGLDMLGIAGGVIPRPEYRSTFPRQVHDCVEERIYNNNV